MRIRHYFECEFNSITSSCSTYISHTPIKYPSNSTLNTQPSWYTQNYNENKQTKKNFSTFSLKKSHTGSISKDREWKTANLPFQLPDRVGQAIIKFLTLKFSDEVSKKKKTAINREGKTHFINDNRFSSPRPVCTYEFKSSGRTLFLRKQSNSNKSTLRLFILPFHVLFSCQFLPCHDTVSFVMLSINKADECCM